VNSYSPFQFGFTILWKRSPSYSSLYNISGSTPAWPQICLRSLGGLRSVLLPIRLPSKWSPSFSSFYNISGSTPSWPQICLRSLGGLRLFCSTLNCSQFCFRSLGGILPYPLFLLLRPRRTLSVSASSSRCKE